ncbi:MAG: putative DNA binding domain-containing protein [candidate division NC10 bacterium]|nr:putative DNA binding domain-containing protein [candidate division NC10 bacterium]MDE2321346.1 putative DNA binding domain-containing protein [candidate division NC10 bacterium]
MLKEDLDHLLHSESETVEWKRSCGEWKEIVVASAAMASLRGGRICIGITPAGEVCGVQLGKGTLEDLANKIAQGTSPRVTPSISSIERDGKTIVVVSVSESTPKPVCAFDRPYRRSGRTNQRLSQEEALCLFMTSRGVTWDQSTLTDATVDADIDTALVRRFLLVARTERRWEVPDETSVDHVLRQLGFIQDGKLTVAAVLLFGRNPQRLLTQAMVRCARFKGTTEVHFLDMKVIQGSIIEQVEEAVAFIKRNIRMAVEIKGLRRDEQWEYPLEGLREAVVNAICHRDYASSANVQIRIFDDRLEVWNPGELPEGMTVEDLRRQHESKPRNKLIANAFFLIKYIEQFGTGIQRILDDCHAQHLPEPNFEVQGHTFRAVFSPGEVKAVQLNDRQMRVMLYVQQRGQITRTQYEKELGVSSRTANRDLKDLVKKGVLSPRGTGPQSKYVLATGEPKGGGV